MDTWFYSVNLRRSVMTTFETRFDHRNLQLLSSDASEFSPFRQNEISNLLLSSGVDRSGERQPQLPLSIRSATNDDFFVGHNRLGNQSQQSPLLRRPDAGVTHNAR